MDLHIKIAFLENSDLAALDPHSCLASNAGSCAATVSTQPTCLTQVACQPMWALELESVEFELCFVFPREVPLAGAQLCGVAVILNLSSSSTASRAIRTNGFTVQRSSRRCRHCWIPGVSKKSPVWAWSFLSRTHPGSSSSDWNPQTLKTGWMLAWCPLLTLWVRGAWPIPGLGARSWRVRQGFQFKFCQQLAVWPGSPTLGFSFLTKHCIWTRQGPRRPCSSWICGPGVKMLGSHSSNWGDFLQSLPRAGLLSASINTPGERADGHGPSSRGLGTRPEFCTVLYFILKAFTWLLHFPLSYTYAWFNIICFCVCICEMQIIVTGQY